MPSKKRALAPRRVHFELSSLAGSVQTRRRLAQCCSSVSRCKATPTAGLLSVTHVPLLQGRAENNLIKAVEESGGRLGSTIMRPGYFFPSNAYPKDAPNQRSSASRLTDKLLGPALSVFYLAGLISVEEIGKFALEAARGKWEGKGGTTFENVE